MSVPGRPPELVIGLPFEGTPGVYVDALNEGDCNRLLAWLRGHPRLHPIVERAVRADQAARRT